MSQSKLLVSAELELLLFESKMAFYFLFLLAEDLCLVRQWLGKWCDADALCVRCPHKEGKCVQG